MTDAPASSPYDPELALALTDLLRDLPETITPDLIGSMRELVRPIRIEDLLAGRAIEHEERLVPGPAGAPDIAISVFRRSGSSGAGPGIYSIHGGGMFMGHRLQLVDAYFDVVEQCDALIVSPEYRLAPEHPDPAPVEDCYAGLTWMAANATALGFDPGALVVAGASAGGGLAAGTTLLARDRSGPLLLGQVLICPMLDDRCETPSSYQCAGTSVWSRHSNLTGWTALLGDRRGTGDVSCYAAPARATDLTNLPPTFIDVGSAEVLRDEAVGYAARILAAGGDAELHVWAGGFHGFDLLVPNAALSKRARAARDQWLGRLLDRSQDRG